MVYFIEVEHDSRIALFQRDPIMLPSPGRRSGAGPICSGAARGRSDILRYAIIIPVHDEADNVEPLLAEIRSVLDGTADARSPVVLHLHSDDPDAVARVLEQHHIPAESRSRRIRLDRERSDDYPVWLFSAEDLAIDLTVLPGTVLRQAPLSGVDERPMRRASAVQLRELLAEAEIAEFERGA